MSIPARTEGSLKGLRAMIDYLESIIDIKELRIIEIGSWVGASAIEFAKRFKKVVCVDPFEPIDETITAHYDMEDVKNLFYANTAPYKNITHINHYSTDFLKQLDRADIIYIDGEHTYEAVKRDIEASLPLKPFILCGHDYWRNRFDGVIKAVDECLDTPDKVFSDTSWVKDMRK